MSKASTRENVKVVCRIRPETKQELAQQGTNCVKHNKTAVEVLLDEGTHAFSFDQIFGPDSKQHEVFDYCAVPLVHDVLEGYNATIFACKSSCLYHLKFYLSIYYFIYYRHVDTCFLCTHIQSHVYI